MFSKPIDHLMGSAQDEARNGNAATAAGFAVASGLFAIAQSIFALAVKSPYGALTQAEIAKLKGDDDG